MSREIDALIAEHVMGEECTSVYSGKDFGTTAKFYSSDIKEAMVLAEKVSDIEGIGLYQLDKHWDTSLEIYIYGCTFKDEPYPDWTWEESQAMAICLAALKVKGIEHE